MRTLALFSGALLLALFAVSCRPAEDQSSVLENQQRKLYLALYTLDKGSCPRARDDENPFASCPELRPPKASILVEQGNTFSNGEQREVIINGVRHPARSINCYGGEKEPQQCYAFSYDNSISRSSGSSPCHILIAGTGQSYWQLKKGWKMSVGKREPYICQPDQTNPFPSNSGVQWVEVSAGRKYWPDPTSSLIPFRGAAEGLKGFFRFTGQSQLKTPSGRQVSIGTAGSSVHVFVHAAQQNGALELTKLSGGDLCEKGLLSQYYPVDFAAITEPAELAKAQAQLEKCSGTSAQAQTNPPPSSGNAPAIALNRSYALVGGASARFVPDNSSMTANMMGADRQPQIFRNDTLSDAVVSRHVFWIHTAESQGLGNTSQAYKVTVKSGLVRCASGTLHVKASDLSAELTADEREVASLPCER